MKPNMGTADRAIRLLIAVAIAVLYFSGRVTGALGVVLLVVAVVFVVTSIFSRCPAYLPLGLSTRGKSTF
jgi:hypothetical protein